MTEEPGERFSFRRISFLMGRRYAPRFWSGKIDVFQIVFPNFTSTGCDPHPRAKGAKRLLICAESRFGSVTKCHAAVPEYNQTFALNAYVDDRLTGLWLSTGGYWHFSMSICCWRTGSAIAPLTTRPASSLVLKDRDFSAHSGRCLSSAVYADFIAAMSFGFWH